MDKSLRALCHTLKKITWQLKPKQNALSFVLLVGRNNQGKSTLMRQSQYDHVAVDADRSADIYYNQQGIILILGESWLNQSKNLLQYTLKQLNHCHRHLKINGIILCVDIHDLFLADPQELATQNKSHVQLLTRFGHALNHRIDTAILFTKLDALAGFCEFFHNDHASELKKPLGFSLDWTTRQGRLLHNYKAQFEQFVEVLGQQIIQKMHPARSSIKRTLIREFPLQLASLNDAIQALIKTISPQLFALKAIYFGSGEQGGISLDRLNKKIQHEYALTVQDEFPQSINHRAYFIEGALHAFQSQTKRLSPPATMTSYHKIAGLIATTAGLSLIWLLSHHLKSTHLLDKTSKELLAYDLLINQQSQQNSPKSDSSSALYHLTQAASTLNQLNANTLYLPTIQRLKMQLQMHSKQQLQQNFIPTILSELEQTIINTRQAQTARYQALKIYLMLGDPTHLSQKAVLAWFQSQAEAQVQAEAQMQAAAQQPVNENIDNKLALLKQILQEPFQPLPINRQLVSDVRNYFNALPASYFYYTLAKDSFSKELQPLNMDGFELSTKALPVYFTKAGFQHQIKELPTIAAQLQAGNWVLARQNLNDLPTLLQQAYCYDYATWWQHFMRKSNPMHSKDYQQARQLTQALHQGNSINNMVQLIQQETSPNFGENSTLFNQEIASKFTDLSLLSHSAVHHLSVNLNELGKFLSTLSVVNDQGRTAFNLSKSRFEGDALSNPLSALYTDARQLPEPLATWTKQIADDTWFILINDSRNYINQQWQHSVVQDYQDTIAKRYPFDANETRDVSMANFDRFFSRHGTLNTFIEQHLKPFLDMSQPQWQLKELNNYVLPISPEMINELIRANVITNMFFPEQHENSTIEFSLQKLSLDPIVSSFQLVVGNTQLKDTQDSDTIVNFHWPETNARLTLNSIEGNHYELDEKGPWAFFKMLQKVNVLVDEQDSSNLQILFEVNGNSGRYVLKTQNQVNPFIPGILNGFVLSDSIA